MKNIKIIITMMIILLGAFLLINKLYDKNDGSVNPEETTTTEEVVPLSTTTETTTTSKQPIRKTIKTFNIKASKQEIMDYAKQEVIKKWGEKEWMPFYNIVLHESNWNPNDVNKSSGACGLFQMHPCNKTSANYKISYEAQIETGINYIATRYKTPTKAWEFWLQHYWY